MGFIKSKRTWLNIAAVGLYVGKAFGFDVPEVDPSIVAVLNILLGFFRTKYGV